jgi:glucan phosphorylase
MHKLISFFGYCGTEARQLWSRDFLPMSLEGGGKRKKKEKRKRKVNNKLGRKKQKKTNIHTTNCSIYDDLMRRIFDYKRMAIVE